MKNFLLKILTVVFVLAVCLGVITACGENVTPSHTHDYETLKYDSENHWYECNCGERQTKENHKGGTATTTHKAVCEVCNQYYGEEVNSSNLTFKTLTVLGSRVYGKVDNNTETFSFIDEIETNGTYTVCLDIYGANSVLTKTIPLSAGDNTVYVFEMDGDEVKNIYTVTIRRRPIYTVNFSTLGSSEASQYVEEDSYAEKPTNDPTRAGYTFTGWDYDFTKAITSDKTINAIWTANTNTKYKVEYYFENIDNDNYTLNEEYTENLTGTTDTIVIAQIKTFEHFTYNENESNISSKLKVNTTLKVYYRRNRYSITFNGNGGKLYNGVDFQSLKYESKIETPIFKKDGYFFTGWDRTIPKIMPAENLIINATWELYYMEDSYIYFGAYPQTIKDENVAVSTTQNDNGYYLGSDGEEYAKVVAYNSEWFYSDYKFSNGTIKTNKTAYYFKVEPIRWRILSKKDNSLLILCDSVIDNGLFDFTSDEFNSTNNYMLSDIRIWLNTNFYNKAFENFHQEIIIKTNIEDASDKVFLLSYDDVVNYEYGFIDEHSREMITTDYCRAKDVLMNINDTYYGNGDWWIYYKFDEVSNFAKTVSSNGTISSSPVFKNYIGIVPALQIKLS